MMLAFRKANEFDELLTFNWVNDDLVRKNSYKSDIIKLEDHINWFKKAIKDKNLEFLIFFVDNNPIGQIRISRINENESLIGILVDINYRGKGYSTSMLKISSDYYLKLNCGCKILAYIKNENITSQKSFLNAGYTFFKEEVIMGVNSKILIYGN